MTLDINFKPQWELLDFEQPEQEYELFDSIASEFNDIAGFPIEYYVLDAVNGNIDLLYGEDPNMNWNGPFRTKIVYEPTNESEVLNSFGFSSDDVITAMMMTKSVFSRDVSYDYVPKVGDVIKTLWNNKMYELTDVGAESKIFNGKKMVWDFICRPFRHSAQSSSADEIIFNTPTNIDFPDINFEYDTKPLSAFGDNEYIEEESDKIDSNSVDSTFYGYDTLD
jgi:hypothetical protein